jgi:hypothetical protein
MPALLSGGRCLLGKEHIVHTRLHPPLQQHTLPLTRGAATRLAAGTRAISLAHCISAPPLGGLALGPHQELHIGDRPRSLPEPNQNQRPLRVVGRAQGGAERVACPRSSAFSPSKATWSFQSPIHCAETTYLAQCCTELSHRGCWLCGAAEAHQLRVYCFLKLEKVSARPSSSFTLSPPTGSQGVNPREIMGGGPSQSPEKIRKGTAFSSRISFTSRACSFHA